MTARADAAATPTRARANARGSKAREAILIKRKDEPQRNDRKASPAYAAMEFSRFVDVNEVPSAAKAKPRANQLDPRPTKGFTTARPAKRLKSRSADHSSRTPCCRQRATIRASWT